MKKTFELEDLDCANCAMKMQEAILKIPGVKYEIDTKKGQGFITDLPRYTKLI